MLSGKIIQGPRIKVKVTHLSSIDASENDQSDHLDQRNLYTKYCMLYGSEVPARLK